MPERVQDLLSSHRNELVSLISRYIALGKTILQAHHIEDRLINNVILEDAEMQKLKDSPSSKVLQSAQFQ